MPNITTNHDITYTNYEYITCNSNKTTCIMSFCQLSCLKIFTENMFVNLGDVERRRFFCFIISLGPTSLVDKRANNRASQVRLKRPTKQRIKEGKELFPHLQSLIDLFGISKTLT